MKSDHLYFRLFRELPDCFFQLIGRPGEDARLYELNAIEYKALVRGDLCAFFHRSFCELNPQVQFLPSWHVELIASELDSLPSRSDQAIDHQHSTAFTEVPLRSRCIPRWPVID